MTLNNARFCVAYLLTLKAQICQTLHTQCNLLLQLKLAAKKSAHPLAMFNEKELQINLCLFFIQQMNMVQITTHLKPTLTNIIIVNLSLFVCCAFMPKSTERF